LAVGETLSNIPLL